MKIEETKRIQDYFKILKKEPLLYQAVKQVTKEIEAEERIQDDYVFARSLYLTVLAPVLVSFVEWVLTEAQKRRIKRLYFLARDGYQMYIAARYICEKKKIPIECRYLYASRYAWRMPQFAFLGEKSLDMICCGGIDVTFQKVMKRGGLTEEESLEIAEELGFLDKYKEVLSYSAVLQLKEPLKKNVKFLNYVYEHSKKSYQTTIAYLKQEGVFETIPYALVDSGWTGSLQQTLTQLLRCAGCEKKLEGFYFGLYELPSKVEKSAYHAYFFSPGFEMKRKVYFSNCLYEVVYSAPHGMTVGYAWEQGNYGPIFYSRYNLNQGYMEREAIWLKSFLQYYQGHKSNKKLCYQLLKKMMGQPTKEEVELYGNLLFSDDVTEEQLQCVAESFTKAEIKNHYVWNRILIMLGLKKQMLKDSAWLEGSIVMVEEGNKWKLLHVRWYKYLIYLRKWLKRGT